VHDMEEMRRHTRTIATVTFVFVALWIAAASDAQEPAKYTPAEETELAMKLSNPLSDLVSVPFQFNWDQKVGPGEDTRFILNLQPAMPFTLSENWNLIARLIVPFVSQPALFEGGSPTFGVSDVLTSFFFSPSRPGAVIWGVGPAISMRSASEPTLGTGKWSAGPSIVVLRQTGPWTYGMLWNQVWSFAGDPARRDVNQMFLQPFVSYQATPSVTLSMSTETTANWESDDHTWTVPIQVFVSKLSSFGPFPASYQLGLGTFVSKPEIGPSWRLRLNMVILLPRRR